MDNDSNLLIFVVIFLIFICCLYYFVKGDSNLLNNKMVNDYNLQSLQIQQLSQPINEKPLKTFESNQMFKTINKDSQLSENNYFITEVEENLKDLKNREIKLNVNIENDNKKIIEFNNDYFNMFDRINNTTSNYNNSVDIINDLKHNNYKIKNSLSILDVYNKIK